MEQANVCAGVLPQQASRLSALDALRGLSVASMIACINPGRWEHALPQLTHAEWVGTPYADMIFPAFLVSVGVAMTLSFAKRVERGASTLHLLAHVLRRGLTLIALGLVLNFYSDPHLATLRLPGVLQRIGLCYILGALLYVPLRQGARTESLRDRRIRLAVIAIAIAMLLAGYLCLLRFAPVPGFGPGHLDSNGNLAAWLDRRIFTIPHLWLYGTTPGIGVTYDPEGLLSSLGALATLLTGLFAGELLRSPASLARRSGSVALAGAAFLAIGFFLQLAIPFIKKLWTPSFASLSGSVALLTLALLLYVIDLRGWQAWSLPLRIFGSNAILAFTLSWILMVECSRLYAQDFRLNVWLYDHLFATWCPAPQLCSLSYALLMIGLNLLLLLPFHRRNWLLRI